LANVPDKKAQERFEAALNPAFDSGEDALWIGPPDDAMRRELVDLEATLHRTQAHLAAFASGRSSGLLLPVAARAVNHSRSEAVVCPSGA